MGFMGIVVVFREWLFNDVAKSWMFIDFKKNLKIRLSSVGQTYLVYTILHVHVWNALTCLHGTMTSEYFDLDPSALQSYFILFSRLGDMR